MNRKEKSCRNEGMRGSEYRRRQQMYKKGYIE
jgi:hypothetical protein